MSRRRADLEIGQTETIARRVTNFSVVCNRCAREGNGEGWAGAAFAGRLDLDLERGIFLCRSGHAVRVQRARAAAGPASTVAA